MNIKKKLGTNSIYFIIVKFITIANGILQTMILSRELGKFEYGTYSQGLLIISICSIFLGFGLENTINYFYNKTEYFPDKKAYVDTIINLSIVLGIIGFIVIMVSHNWLIGYFNNYKLRSILIYIAIKPLVANLILIFQSLYISNGMAKTIAIRNLLVSAAQVIIIGIITVTFKNIKFIFIALVLLDILQVMFFAGYFNKKCFKVNVGKIDKSYIKEIINYSIPLALALMIGTILKEMDKLFITKMMTIEDLALYTNVSKQLPFEFIGSSFTLVVTPIIISFISLGNFPKAIKVWSDYIKIGYISTWILCGGALVVAPELLCFLYSSKYIDGLNIFVVYIIIDMFRFTYFGLILTAKNRTNIILMYSIITLILNFLLNILFFFIWGIIGPAIASLISIGIIAIAQLIHSAKIINASLVKVLDIRKMITLLVQMTLVGYLVLSFKVFIYRYISVNMIILFLCYLLFVVVMLLLNFGEIKRLIVSLNSID